MRARVDTGPVRHALALQASTYHDRIATASNMGTAILSNLYAPVSAPEPFIAAPAAVPKTSSSQLSGVALADTMGVLDDRLQLTLGLRQQQVNSDNFSASTGAVTASYDKRDGDADGGHRPSSPGGATSRCTPTTSRG